MSVVCGGGRMTGSAWLEPSPLALDGLPSERSPAATTNNIYGQKPMLAAGGSRWSAPVRSSSPPISRL